MPFTAAAVTPVSAGIARLIAVASDVTVVPLAVIVTPLIVNVLPAVIVGLAFVPATVGHELAHSVLPTLTHTPLRFL